MNALACGEVDILPISTKKLLELVTGAAPEPIAAKALAMELTLPPPIPQMVETPRGRNMDVTEVDLERMAAKDFFAREYLLDDIRWMVARLLGKFGASGDLGREPDATIRRATA
jgi:hypothetical protein